MGLMAVPKWNRAESGGRASERQSHLSLESAKDGPPEMPRPLFHLGGREFWPAGAEGVRVQFVEAAKGLEMRVTDGELEMKAVKEAGK